MGCALEMLIERKNGERAVFVSVRRVARTSQNTITQLEKAT